jgi:hypothetical protein
MGLGIEVGILADLRENNDDEGFNYYLNQFDVLNRCLQSVGLPVHNEPEDCEIWSCDMFGFSGLHYLRRLAAYLDHSGRTPPPGDKSAAEDPILQQYYESNIVGRFDHLICHSDADGFYLPIDFLDVLFPDAGFGIVGGVGSTIQLLRECEHLAQILEIPKHLDENSKELYDASNSQGEGSCLWEKYGIESYICVRLMRGCQHSIRTQAAIVFV